jgi:enoyl-CoA hydratase/carnithine racemase
MTNIIVGGVDPLVAVSRPGDGIAVVTLNRADHLNSFNFAFADALADVMDGLATDAEVRAIVLAAEGRVFSAGLDLADLSPLPGTEGFGRVQAGLAGQERLVRLVPLLHRHPKPVIAAVQGAAVGMGMAIALAADVRVASPSASFAAAFIRVGLSACDFGLSYLLPRLVGAGRSAEILLTGSKVSAEEAADVGLVTSIVDSPDSPVDEAVRIASSIAAHSPFGVAMTKDVMWTNLDAPSLEAAMAIENRTQTLALLTDDMSEAVAAFLEKRPAAYANR